MTIEQRSPRLQERAERKRLQERQRRNQIKARLDNLANWLAQIDPSLLGTAKAKASDVQVQE